MKENAGSSIPLISIIIVVYNAVELLEETISSVIKQTYKNIELIIIDGGSTDGTAELLGKYGNYINFWTSEADEGIYDAMNKGVKAARGDWIYFLGAGDILLNVLHHVAKRLIDPAVIYYGNVYLLNAHSIYDGQFSAYKLAVKNISHQAIFYPAGALNKYKFELKYKTLADHYLNMQCFGDKTFKFTYIPVLVCVYEGEGFSATNHIDKAFFRDKIKIVKANFPFTVFCYAYLRRSVAKIMKLTKGG